MHTVAWWTTVLRGCQGKFGEGKGSRGEKDNTRVGEKGLSLRAISH